MIRFASKLLPFVHVFLFGVLGLVMLGFTLTLVPLDRERFPSQVSNPKNACEGGAICEPWMELLRNYEPPPAVVRSPKRPKLQVRPSRRPQFG